MSEKQQPKNPARFSGVNRMQKAADFGSGSTNCFQFENQVTGVGVEQVDGVQKALPVFIIDPCQNQTSPGNALRTATIFSAAQGDGASFLSVLQARIQRRDNPVANTAFPVFDFSNYGVIQTSAANATQTVSFDTKGLNTVLTIIMTTSAGTATVDLRGSHDNFATMDVDIDSIGAAASTIKNYINSSVGGTTAISPIAFRFLKINVGAAGVGNTTTLTVNMK